MMFVRRSRSWSNLAHGWGFIRGVRPSTLQELRRQ